MQRQLLGAHLNLPLGVGRVQGFLHLSRTYPHWFISNGGDADYTGMDRGSNPEMPWRTKPTYFMVNQTVWCLICKDQR